MPIFSPNQDHNYSLLWFLSTRSIRVTGLLFDLLFSRIKSIQKVDGWEAGFDEGLLENIIGLDCKQTVNNARDMQKTWNKEVSLVTAPVQVQSISPLSSSGRVARFLGGSNRGCAGSEIARVGVESTKKPTPDVVVVSRRDVTALALSYGTFPLRKV
ncbi:hypothetical protein TNCV_3059751 [Trichonephila clavipes]|nr:hypothetical protein TNCV_3059751 [Trichonephila clavipes]